MPGTLFVVSTPIGNLEDITLRALRVLRESAVVAAEDTRRTRGLLGHFEISTPLVSLHEHNERARVPELLARLRSGDHVALVTDAGTPLVSDPGLTLVTAARSAGIAVCAIPGPSAVLAALVASGLAADSFTFMGFAPAKGRERERWLAHVAAEPRTTVFFEAPHRIASTLSKLAGLAAGRQVVVARELTKVHEEIVGGPIEEIVKRLGEPRGEYTVVVAAPPEPVEAPQATDEALWRDYCGLTSAGVGRRDAISTLSRRYGRPSREIFDALERGRAAHAP